MSGSVGTPALAVLQTRGIAHTVHSYEIVEPTGVETHRGERAAYGPAAAAALGIAPARLFKTLVCLLENGRPGGELVLAVLPSDAALSERAVAQAFGAKRAALASVEQVQRVTGSVPGGVSPLGGRKVMRTLIDTSAEGLATLFISAGRRGLAVELAPADLLAACSGIYASIAVK
jgi:Cys-tRNA(Pro)/Cys-tRNA(Cys) deacylase